MPGQAMAAPEPRGPWSDPTLPPDRRAGLLLRELTLDEKISLLGGDEVDGVLGGPDSHIGTGHGIERLGVPTVRYGDGPIGARQGEGTALPATISLAASFDTELAERYAAVVGNEIRCKGNDVLFGPTIDVLRTPLSGRGFEGFGEDPYLTSGLAVPWIVAARREGLIVCAKHLGAYVQEGAFGLAGSRLQYDAMVDERTLREIYLPPFEAAVREADVGSVMGAYNKLNGQYCCENQWLLNDLLKQEWGFPGYTLADYGAVHSTAASLNNGLDFEPWPALFLSPGSVSTAVHTGKVSTADIDDHVRRILRTMFAHGLFERTPQPPDDDLIDRPGHLAEATRIAEQGMTLLANDGMLPLDEATLAGGRIAVIGEAADRFVQGGGSSSMTPFSFVSAEQGLAERAGSAITVEYDKGRIPEKAAEAARGADVAVVVVADLQSEFTDKPDLDVDAGLYSFPNVEVGDPFVDQDAVIEAVLDANPNTVVVLHTGGPVLMPWRHRARAVLQAWYAGSGAGTAVARVLFGDVDPGGRLPVTFPEHEEDLPTAGDPQRYPGVGGKVHFDEGVFVGYRHFDQQDIEPAYPFGHGLSYTEFDYRDLQVEHRAVHVSVTNTGARPGSTAPQLYLGLPAPNETTPQPPKQLKGFAKLHLEPGETRRVTFPLTDRDLSYWDGVTGQWRIAPGTCEIMVGESSRDIRLTGRSS
ncbi:glycoside hydrolase family 3 C-terminal domain-containing protein [Saccharopolyspora sp. HNM0983]|uniref:Glycoside hydrolase family 3 C-terminal domain-containing protein n=2 Tax=Saccharopolyspora montiporae TaxID=2781240 RepID=A0A929BAL4_9PSEU|nr:glycoside hydrolase family 3 C-terminal domain-containing protein [Saccharopolyspora sp. HNM0983]